MNSRELRTTDEQPDHAQHSVATVLLVEDDASHARIAQRSFDSSQFPYELTTVGRIQEARDAIAVRVPDLVIADLLLPDGRGTDLITNPSEAAFPVIVLTSQGDERAAVESIKNGALDYVVKSAETFLDLPHLVRRSLREWRHIRARREVERRLARNERRFRAMLDAIPDLMLTLSRDGRILDCRGGMREFEIEGPAYVIGAGLSQLIPEEAASSVVEAAGDVLSNEEVRTVNFELPLRDRVSQVEARIIPCESDRVLAILRDVSETQQVAGMLKSLTPREREVLQLVAEGRSNKQMALKLRLSVKTVEAHRARLMRKLGTRNMAELMRLALAAEEHLCQFAERGPIGDFRSETDAAEELD